MPDIGKMFMFMINSNLCPCLFLYRWCVCMDHEDFEKLCATAFRIIAATHKENCNCPCSFCDICNALSYISVSWLMEHLLCAGSRRFPTSSFNCSIGTVFTISKCRCGCTDFFIYYTTSQFVVYVCDFLDVLTV